MKILPSEKNSGMGSFIADLSKGKEKLVAFLSNYSNVLKEGNLPNSFTMTILP